MPIVKFETGQRVRFNQTPSEADIEEVAQKLGITKKSNIGTKPAEKKCVLRKIGEGIVKPFAEVGVGLYNAGKATADLARGNVQEAGQELKTSRNLPFLGETKPFMEGDENFG